MNHFLCATRACIAIALASAFCLRANAQDKPMASAQLKKLVATAGEWQGSRTYTENGAVTPIKARHKTSVFADGLGVQVLENASGQGMPEYKAINLFAYDEGEGLVHLYTVDNYGDVHDHKGKWSDDNTLKLRHEGVSKGKKFVEDVTTTFNSTNEFHILSIVSLDGVKTSTYDVTMKRTSMKAAAK